MAIYSSSDWDKQQAEQRRRFSCQRCYTWLGEDLTILREKTFKSYQREIFPEAYDQLRAFCGNKEDPYTLKPAYQNFIIHGGYGTGKTHLLCATLNMFCRRLIPARFMTGQGLFDAIGRSIGEHHSYQSYLDEASTIPILGIDDIDKIHIPARTRDSESNFQVSTFFAILNRRSVKRLPTLITTNAMDITPYVGGAAFSRMKECGNFIKMDGEDYRESL